MGKGSGFGKTILFGEHFVVYGAPAIAAGLSNEAIIEVIPSDKNRIITKIVVIEELSLGGIAGVLESLGIKQKYDVYLTGDLPTYGGLGSSAAFCVALAKAFAQEKGIRLTNEQVNSHAYNGEKAFHGNPSGVDNHMATYGGVAEFIRGKTSQENKFEQLKIEKPLNMVISFSGKYSPTLKMVEIVKKFREEDPNGFTQIMDQYLEIEKKAKKVLEKGQLDELGKLMNANQNLLKQIGVSDELNDKIIEIANSEGALGAKVTGGGGGGCCLILAKDEKHSEKIAKKLNEKKFFTFQTRIGR